MKPNHAKLWGFLFLALAAVLTLDAGVLYSDISLPGGGFKTGSDHGTGLYLLFGIVEITDRLPYDSAPGVFYLLCGVVALAVAAALCFFGFARYSNRKKATV